MFASYYFLTKMESASYCNFLASFYKLMRKLDRSTVLHTSTCKLPFPIYQESSPDSSMQHIHEKWFSTFQNSDSVIIVMYIQFYYPKFQFLLELLVQLTLSSKVFPKTNVHYIYVADFDQLLKPTLKLLDQVQLLELKGTYQRFMFREMICPQYFHNITTNSKCQVVTSCYY